MARLSNHDISITYPTEAYPGSGWDVFRVHHRHTGRIEVRIALPQGPQWAYSLPYDCPRFFDHLSRNSWGLLPAQYAFLQAHLSPECGAVFVRHAPRVPEDCPVRCSEDAPASLTSSTALIGYLCEDCLDAPAVAMVTAPWSGEMGICDACLHKNDASAATRP
jgi:hypothetical protein